MKKLYFALLLISHFAAAESPDSLFGSSTKQPLAPPVQVTDTVFTGDGRRPEVCSALHNRLFRNNTYFESATFAYPAQFYSCLFYRDVFFSGSTFKGLADFCGTMFSRDATFKLCIFEHILFLSNVKADDSLAIFNFYGARLPDLIDFSHNKKLARIVDFTDADFTTTPRDAGLFHDTRHFINIFDSDISKLKLDYLHFRLCFYDRNKTDAISDTLEHLKQDYEKVHKDTAGEFKTVYGQFTALGDYSDYIHRVFPGISLNDKLTAEFTLFYFINGQFPRRLSDDQTEALYSRLLKNFDNNGQKQSYQRADVDRQNFLAEFPYPLPLAWNDYGYHKEWIFAWTLFFLILLTLITYRLSDRLLVASPGEDPVYDLAKMPSLNEYCSRPKRRRLKCAFIFTSIIFFSFRLKTENLTYKRNSFFYVVIINVIGLLCLGYLVNFILQK